MVSWSLCRSALGIALGAAMLTACASNAGTVGAPQQTGAISDLTSNSQTFNYTGAEQTFKVPSGVTSISVVADGAGGYRAGDLVQRPPKKEKALGLGGRTEATVPVTAGETLYIFVGGQGTSGSGGYNGGGGVPSYSGRGEGGGGGGGSDVRQGGDSLGDRILVAGGGGGPGEHRGGNGGGTTGMNGTGRVHGCYGGGGGGGTQTQGGAGGAGGCPGGSDGGDPGGAGSLGQGGSGGAGPGGVYGPRYGGGGGGGYYGGGGGGGGGSSGSFPNKGGGGGGGSSYAESSASGVMMWQGYSNDTGNGQITFSWQ